MRLSDEDIADFEVLRDVAIVTVFGFLYTRSVTIGRIVVLRLHLCTWYYNVA